MPNSSIKLKICGITQPEQALEIASLGVSAIGVIGVKESPRFISPTKRSQIFKQLSKSFPKTKRVLVVADIDESELDKIILREGSPSIIQLHGNESQELCKKFREKYPNIQFWKALRIRSQEDIALTTQYENVIDALLLDSWNKDQLGGTGKKLPIKWLQNKKFKIPWWIAGGISADSISDILLHLNPFGIDASSKLETSIGIKDLKKVRELIKTLR